MEIQVGRTLLADVLELTLAEVPEDATVDSFPAWDSLAHMRLVAQLEQMIGRELSGDEVLALDSVAALEKLLIGVVA